MVAGRTIGLQKIAFIMRPIGAKNALKRGVQTIRKAKRNISKNFASTKRQKRNKTIWSTGCLITNTWNHDFLESPFLSKELDLSPNVKSSYYGDMNSIYKLDN